MIRLLTGIALSTLATLSLSGAAEAKGCIKGALVGGVAGHMAGHGKMGAAAGCRHRTPQGQQEGQAAESGPAARGTVGRCFPDVASPGQSCVRFSLCKVFSA